VKIYVRRQNREPCAVRHVKQQPYIYYIHRLFKDLTFLQSNTNFYRIQTETKRLFSAIPLLNMAEKIVVSTSEAPAPIAPFSQGIIHNGLVYCSGSVGLDPKTNQIIQGGIKERTVSIKSFNFPRKSFNWMCA
jgi:hypothetical protein